MKRAWGLRGRLRALLTLNESPGKVAASFAVGVFIGISPLFGVHTFLGMLLAYAFRLNMVATITGVYVTNPWTMIPIYTFTTWVGTKILGTDFLSQGLDFSHLTFSNVVGELKHLLVPFVVGSFSIAAVAAVIFYVVVYLLMKRIAGGSGK